MTTYGKVPEREEKRKCAECKRRFLSASSLVRCPDCGSMNHVKTE